MNLIILKIVSLSITYKKGDPMNNSKKETILIKNVEN